ncbi:serine hydrolase [Actinokineospora sp. UTMC 2448]|uniref:serine hydrolase domain-containing protein n=1 Tax=Actinokineospora sp. UTMC 2448 TaxID=2268449 RepID=UPI002200E9D4|nr:Esterase EstB [Actinokineospora sp. UTMC 2448]
MRTAAVVATVVLTMASSGAAAAEPAMSRFDRPHHGFADTTLRPGTPQQAGLDPAPIDAAAEAIAAWTRPAPQRPLFSGAVALMVHDGVIVHHSAVGQALRYADAAGTELPAEQQVPMRPDTVFDVASVSKLFTSLAVMCLVEDGEVAVTDPVAEHVPEFAANGKAAITVEQLLTHTSGMEPWIPLWRDWPDRESRLRAALERAPRDEPGTRYVYSDLNLIALGVLVERVSGVGLDEFLAQRITGPLGLDDTGYNPTDVERTAATEYQATPPRGMVRGQVHDENAWSLGGVAGHAGVFSTARDLAVLAQTILNGGQYGGTRVLKPETVRAMLTDYNTEFPGNAHGLGFELDQRWYMGGLSGPRTAGHTGFTGTSLVIDPASRSIAILLTNRVHPSRSWGSINKARETWATGLARAMAVPPKHGPTTWFAAQADASTATLTTPELAPRGPVRVAFDAFVDSEGTDPLTVEYTVDGAEWRTAVLQAAGRGAPRGDQTGLAGSGHRSWWSVHAELPYAAMLTIRWRSTTDGRYTGRGIHLDRILVTDSDGILLNGEKQPHLMLPVGWTSETR